MFGSHKASVLQGERKDIFKEKCIIVFRWKKKKESGKVVSLFN